VCVPLDGSDTAFVDAHGTLPSGHHVTLDTEPDLTTLLLTLWPARAEVMRHHVDGLGSIDNRLDLEAALQATAALIVRWVEYWRRQDDGWRHARLRSLSPHAPWLANLLESTPVRTVADPPDGLVPDLASEAPRREVDDEHWAAWNERTPEEILGPDGALARLIGDGFEFRAGQRDMSESVAKALDRQEHLMVEAGTGIGKSLAYLVPSLLHGGRSGERVVISTHTRNLQSQLIDHDLPLLERLGYPGEVRLLLGRNNYLCRRQLRRVSQARVESTEEALAQFALVFWARHSREGRREELADHPWFSDHWLHFFDSVEPCSPHICHRDPVCFVVRARRRAREAPVVVVNHALLMMDLRSGQSLVGPARVLVVDEAHHLHDVATRALSHWIAPERLEVYRNLTGDRSTPGALREVFTHVVRAAGGNADTEACARATDRALEHFLETFLIWYTALAELVAARLGSDAGRPGTHRIHDADEAFEREALASLLEFHRDFRAQIAFCAAADDEDWVYWLDWAGRGGLRGLVAAPLTVEDPLGSLWNAHYRSVVMTSATLAVESDFLPFAESVGLSRADRFTESLQIPSPFEAERQSLVLTSIDLPEPDDAHFATRVAETVAAIATAVPTKILVLSTSYRFVDQLEAELANRLAPSDDDLFADVPPVRPTLLVQRPGLARAALAERFRLAEAAVLVATGSFWEGVDFPGRQLEVLVVPRLPFSVPTDPLVEGRTERARRLGRDPFHDVTLVDAVLRLKQGVGRLLRTSDDRGAVLLLDHRLQSRGYGVRFLNSLPRICDIVPDLDEVARRTVDFLRGRNERD
jgi:Rad3-related DNA helicase